MVLWDCSSKRGEFCHFTGTISVLLLVGFSRVSRVRKVKVGIRVSAI